MIQDPTVNTRQAAPWPVVNNDNLADNYGPGERIRVRCIHPPGIYYDFVRRREGDVFDLIPMYVTQIDPNTGRPKLENGEPVKRLVTAKEQFIPDKMERVDETVPVQVTTAQGALNRKQDELNEAKAPRKR